jgi:hypothetical protein
MSSESVNQIQQASDLPRERVHFKELLLADHFKLASAEGAPPQGNTTYEQLVCIGYRPQFKRLDGVVQIKQSSGYSGGICTAGSQEYIRFFASTDNGATWTDLGLTSFTTWDVPGPKPLDFDVSIPVDLAAACCQDENLVQIRGVLSWEVPPASPAGPIVWGNSLDVTVQVAPLVLGTLADFLLCLPIHVELESAGQVASLEQLVEFGPAPQLAPKQLYDLYQGTEVPQARYLLPSVAERLGDAGALSAAAHQPGFDLIPTLADVADLGAILGIIGDPQGNETYEQLGCVGLNTVTDELAATIDIKQSSGYSGGLCTAGSQEYAAFWADWGSGFEYAGTASVNVHDISSFPAAGLQYSVALPFPQALTRRRPCQEGPLTVTIRAVLSWATPPSEVNPFAVPVWGGHLEAVVLIPPGQAVTGGPVLETIGSMPVPTISDVTGLATGTSVVPDIGYANGCPFGEGIEITGVVIDPATGSFGGPGIQFRVLVSTNGGLSFTPLTQPFQVYPLGLLFPVLQTPDPVTGWCDYLNVDGDLLGTWASSGNGQIWISLQAQQYGVPIGATSWQLVQLDNTPPDPVSIEITTGAGSCGDFSPGDLIGGSYSAADNENLRAVSIGVEAAMPGATLTQVVTAQTLLDETGTWSLQTLPSTEPCGYVMVATASDNTIVGSGRIGFETLAFQGFCLRPAAQG